MCAHVRTPVRGFFVVSNSRTKGGFQKPKDRLATTQLSGLQYKLCVIALVPLKIFLRYFLLVTSRGMAAYASEYDVTLSLIACACFLPHAHTLFLGILHWLLTSHLPLPK